MAGEDSAERLAVLLEARIRDFEKNMAKASGTATRNYDRMRRGSRSATRQMEQDMARSTARINAALASTSTRIGAFTQAFGVGFAGLGVAGLIQSVRSVSSKLAKIGDTADRIGVATEELQRLRIAAERTGGSAEALDRGMATFARNISQAASGSGELRAVLEANGVALHDSNGRLRSTNDLLMDFANLVRGARSPADQLRLATIAFGQSGTELVGMLRGGADEVRRIGDEADKAGHVLSDEVIRKAQDLDEKFKAVTRTVGTALKNAIVSAAGALSRFLGLLSSLRVPMGDAVPVEDIGKRLQDIASDIAKAEKDLADAHARAKQFGPMMTKGRVDWLEKEIALLKEEARLLHARSWEIQDAPGSTPGAPASPTTMPTTGSGSSTSSGREGPFERAQQRLRERIELLKVETETLGLSSQAAETARMKVELLNAAKRAGIKETPELTAEVEKLAASWGRAAAEAEQAKEQFQRMQNFASSSIDTLVNGLTDVAMGSKTVKEAFRDMAQSIIRDFIQMTIRALIFRAVSGMFSGGGMVGGGTALPGIGGLFASGGHVRGPGTGTSDSIPAMLSNGEFVVNARATARHRPLLEAINNDRAPGFAEGGFVSDRSPTVPHQANAGSRTSSHPTPEKIQVSIGWSHTADGNLKPFVERVATERARSMIEPVARSNEELRRTLPQQIGSVIRAQQVRGTRI